MIFYFVRQSWEIYSFGFPPLKCLMLLCNMYMYVYVFVFVYMYMYMGRCDHIIEAWPPTLYTCHIDGQMKGWGFNHAVIPPTWLLFNILPGCPWWQSLLNWWPAGMLGYNFNNSQASSLLARNSRKCCRRMKGKKDDSHDHIIESPSLSYVHFLRSRVVSDSGSEIQALSLLDSLMSYSFWSSPDSRYIKVYSSFPVLFYSLM